MEYCCDLCSALKNFVTVSGLKIGDQSWISRGRGHASIISGPAMTLRALSVLDGIALKLSW